MKEQVVKYKNCDYRCYVKTMRRGKGRPYDRVFCGKVDPKCGRVPKSNQHYLAADERQRLKPLFQGLRTVLLNAKSYGETLSDLQHIFKDYKTADVREAIQEMLFTGRVRRISSGVAGEEDRFVSTDKRARLSPEIDPRQLKKMTDDFYSSIAAAKTKGVAKADLTPVMVNYTKAEEGHEKDLVNQALQELLDAGLIQFIKGRYYVITQPEEALMADIRLYIGKSGIYGNTLRDVELAFISRDRADVKDALDALVEDGSIRRENGKYVTTDPRSIARTKQMQQKYTEQMRQSAKYIKPFPPPVPVAQIFSAKNFHAYKPDLEKHVLEGRTIIGVPSMAVLKTFRPELTAQLEKLQQKNFYQKPGSQEHEEFKDNYERVFTSASTEVEWKLVGMISAADTKKSVLTQASTDVAVFVDCKRGQITEVNARYIHIVQDVCPNARYFSHGPDYAMVAVCDETRVMVVMPLRISMSRDEQGTLANVLCERL